MKIDLLRKPDTFELVLSIDGNECLLNLTEARDLHRRIGKAVTELRLIQWRQRRSATPRMTREEFVNMAIQQRNERIARRKAKRAAETKEERAARVAEIFRRRAAKKPQLKDPHHD